MACLIRHTGEGRYPEDTACVCGTTPRVYQRADHTSWRITCPACRISTDPMPTRAAALTAWNEGIEWLASEGTRGLRL